MLQIVRQVMATLSRTLHLLASSGNSIAVLFDSRMQLIERLKERAPRTDIELPVTCSHTWEYKTTSLRTENMSMSGLKFVSQEPLKVGDTLDMTIGPYSNLPRFNARGRVVWCQYDIVGKDAIFIGGIRFIHLDELENKILKRYVDLSRRRSWFK